jgi:hypothetical protein
MTSGETFTIALIDDDDDLRTATEQLLVIAGYVVQLSPLRWRQGMPSGRTLPEW